MPAVVNTYSAETFTDSEEVAVSAVGSGNAIIVIVRYSSTVNVTQVTDNGGATPTYTLDYTTAGANGDTEFAVFSRLNVTDAPTEVRIILDAGDLFDYLVVEASGIATSAAFDESNSSVANTATPSVGFTTDSANQLGVGGLVMTSGRTVTAGGTATWTERQPYADPVFDTFFTNPDLGAAGAKTLAPTLDSGVQNALIVVSYRAAAAGSTPRNLMLMGVG